eukprot:Skav221665  [mRNA]  locus=scaffold1750:275453:308368:+ [translate_table: standard]
MGCCLANAASDLVALPQSLAASFPSYESFARENKAAAHEQLLTSSFAYQIKQETVKGLTLDICHSGKLTPELEKSFVESIKALEVPRSPTAAGASVICGDTGFMMWFQPLARRNTKLPVILSSLAVLPSITCSYGFLEQRPEVKFLWSVGGAHEKIAVLTANSEQLKPMATMIHDECGVDFSDERFIFGAARRGCDDGERPVFDALSLCAWAALEAEEDACGDFYIDSHMDNPRFGEKDWDEAKKARPPRPRRLSNQAMVSFAVRSQKDHISLGVIRLDYHYPPAPGDVAHPGSYPYEVHYHMVKGLTFEMCQSGKLTPEVEAAFLQGRGLKALEAKGVIMSSLATLPAITSSYTRDEQIAIFTANGKSLLGVFAKAAVEVGEDVASHRPLVYGPNGKPFGVSDWALKEAWELEMSGALSTTTVQTIAALQARTTQRPETTLTPSAAPPTLPAEPEAAMAMAQQFAWRFPGKVGMIMALGPSFSEWIECKIALVRPDGKLKLEHTDGTGVLKEAAEPSRVRPKPGSGPAKAPASSKSMPPAAPA